ncbi:MAG: hypothetical protein GXX08_12310 [Firmicutes bacterium]|nr:hypothetical protein [Bacillota bacterium]
MNNKYMTPLRTAQAIAKMTPAIAIMTGTVNHGEIIPPPSGYTPEQCTWFVSPTTSAFNQYFGGFRCYADANRTVVAQWFDAGVSEWKPISANYIIIGVK